MQTRTMQCPRCHREVHLAVTDSPLHGESQATLPDAEVVCLEARSCSDGSCAVTGFSGTTMRTRLSHAVEEDVIHEVRHVTHADFLE